MPARRVLQGTTLPILAAVVALGCGGSDRKWAASQAGAGGDSGASTAAGADHGGRDGRSGNSAVAAVAGQGGGGLSGEPRGEAGNEAQTGGLPTVPQGGAGGSGHDPTGGRASSAAGSDGTGGTQGEGGSGGEPTAGSAGSAGDCADGCLISGDCVDAQTVNPDNECEACKPEDSADSWTALTDTSCDDGLFCNGADTCSAGECRHAGNPCDGDSACRESDDLCCTPAVSTVCGSDGNVHDVDACGTEGAVTEQCAGDCLDGACRCVIHLNGEGGTDSNTGLSWGAAKRTLQAAIDAAADAGGCEVWATAAMYAAGSGSAREDVIALEPGVAVYGGFEGLETKRSERDFAANQTIITGEPSVYSPTPEDTSDDAYHVLIGADDAVLDGFTISAGNANGDEALGRDCGGGLRNDGVSPTISNCQFTANRAEYRGGAICNLNGAAPRIEDCTFTDNVATSSGGGYGGAIYNQNSSPVIVDSAFSSHTLARGKGAALSNSGGSATVIGCTFEDNTARDGGGAVHDTDQATSLYRGCTFVNNRTGYSAGGALHSHEASPIIVGCEFSENQGVGGGALYFGPGTPYVANSIFRANRASTSGGGFGGAAECSQSAPTFVNCLFVSNEAVEGTGGSPGEGGALGMAGGGATIVNSTFYGNIAAGTDGRGGAIVLDNATLTTISNSIFSENVAGTGLDIYHPTGAAWVTHSVVRDTVDCQEPGTCIIVDPGFFDVQGGDFTPQNSACIDSADSARLPADTADLDGDGNAIEAVPSDFSGGARVRGAGLDRGAVETG